MVFAHAEGKFIVTNTSDNLKKRQKKKTVLTRCRWAPAWCQAEDWWGRRTVCSGGHSSHLWEKKKTEETFRAGLGPSLVLLHYTVHQPGNEPYNCWKYDSPLFLSFSRDKGKVTLVKDDLRLFQRGFVTTVNYRGRTFITRILIYEQNRYT